MDKVSFHSEETDFTIPGQQQTSIADWLRSAVAEHDYDIEAVSIIFCSDAYLLNLNQSHLSHDYYTDIITFPYNENPISADLFISIERVRDNAQKVGCSFDHELNRVMIHGLLHLLDYNDKTPGQQAKMRKKEDYYLNLLPEKSST